MSVEYDIEKDTEIELPLVKMTKQDVLGALFVYTDNVDEMYKDALLKLQTWIINFAEEQVSPLRESGQFSEEEIEEIKKSSCVISPITMALYLHWLQMEEFIKQPDSKKEELLLQKFPDRFKARYKGNEACRNARETIPEDDDANDTEEESDLMNMSFAEFVRKLGTEIKNNKEK